MYYIYRDMYNFFRKANWARSDMQDPRHRGWAPVGK